MSRGAGRDMPPSRRRLRAARARRARQRRIAALVVVALALVVMIFLVMRSCGSAAGSSLTEDRAEASAGSGGGDKSGAGTMAETVSLTVAGAVNSTAAPPAPPARPAFELLSFPPSPRNPAAVVQVPILMFHHVGDTPPGADEIRAGLTVSAADFDGMMGYLKQGGFNTISLAQLFKALYMDVPLPPRPVMLTFDDGYLDNYQVAAPTMAKYGFTGTFFIISDKVGTPEYMSWDQVREVEAGGIEIGVHSATHADLTTLDSAGLQYELAASGAAISAQLGHPVYWLCYPAGKYDADVINFSHSLGFLMAVTTEPGETHCSDSPFALTRYRVRHDTGVAGFQQLVG